MKNLIKLDITKKKKDYGLKLATPVKKKTY